VPLPSSEQVLIVVMMKASETSGGDWAILMIQVGIDAADDEKRQRVLADFRGWLVQRC